MEVIKVRGRLPRQMRVTSDIPNLIEIQLNSYAWFREEGKDEYGAYFVDVERIGDCITRGGSGRKAE